VSVLATISSFGKNTSDANHNGREGAQTNTARISLSHVHHEIYLKDEMI